MIECPDCHKTIVDPCAVELIQRERRRGEELRAALAEARAALAMAESRLAGFLAELEIALAKRADP